MKNKISDFLIKELDSSVKGIETYQAICLDITKEIKISILKGTKNELELNTKLRENQKYLTYNEYVFQLCVDLNSYHNNGAFKDFLELTIKHLNTFIDMKDFLKSLNDMKDKTEADLEQFYKLPSYLVVDKKHKDNLLLTIDKINQQIEEYNKFSLKYKIIQNSLIEMLNDL